MHMYRLCVGSCCASTPLATATPADMFTCFIIKDNSGVVIAVPARCPATRASPWTPKKPRQPLHPPPPPLHTPVLEVAGGAEGGALILQGRAWQAVATKELARIRGHLGSG
jgi:hypothetical protein